MARKIDGKWEIGKYHFVEVLEGSSLRFYIWMPLEYNQNSGDLKSLSYDTITREWHIGMQEDEDADEQLENTREPDSSWNTLKSEKLIQAAAAMAKDLPYEKFAKQYREFILFCFNEA